MKQSKLLPLLVLILVIAIIAPAGAKHLPVSNNRLVKHMIDDHPWGGEANPTHNVPDRTLTVGGSSGMPFIFFDIYQIVIIVDFRINDAFDEEDDNGEIIPEDYTNSNNSNSGLPTRGN